jgi:hypothetical protein
VVDLRDIEIFVAGNSVVVSALSYKLEGLVFETL